MAISGGDAKPLFRARLKAASESEVGAVQLMESAYTALGVFGDSLQDRYQQLSRAFIANRNLAYGIGDEFTLYPTMTGVFGRMLEQIRARACDDKHLNQLLEEYEEAFRDLRQARTEARLKTCLLRQFNLIEALGRGCQGVTAQTLGAICDQRQWPHPTIRDVGKKLYGFRSDYPGLGHAGNPRAVTGPISMKDFVSLNFMLASLTPYFIDQLDAERCYGG